MYRVFSADKLRALRGKTARRKIAERVPGLLSEMDIYHYEKGVRRPDERKAMALMLAFNCSWNKLSEPKNPQELLTA